MINETIQNISRKKSDTKNWSNFRNDTGSIFFKCFFFGENRKLMNPKIYGRIM